VKNQSKVDHTKILRKIKCHSTQKQNKKRKVSKEEKEVRSSRLVGRSSMSEVLKLGPWNDSSVIWVCEEHPTKEQSHKVGILRRECGGAGMPEITQENRDKGYIN